MNNIRIQSQSQIILTEIDLLIAEGKYKFLKFLFKLINAFETKIE